MFKSRRCLPYLMLLVISAPLCAQDTLEYLNDSEIRQAIEKAGTVMLDEETATPNEALQDQLQRATTTETLPGPQSLTHDGEDIYNKAADSVLVISGLYLCGRCDNYHARPASGFILSEDGLAVTNHHVVKNADNLTLVAMTRDGRVLPVLEVVASNERDDIAIIRLGGEGPFTPLPIARTAHVGERVHTITHPDGKFYTYTSGEIARFHMEPHRGGPPVRRIQITADYAKGSSGGPILNDQGQVVAVVTTTDSVYYTETDGKQENLQMVFYNCVSFESILDLFQPETTAATPAEQPVTN